LKEEEVFQQEKIEGQRRKGWTNNAGAALSFGVSVGGEAGVQVGREGTTSNGEGECEGRGQAHRTQKHAAHATQLRTVCLLLAGMGWDGMVWPATIIL
jgi:hypothetical protein